MNTGFKYFPEKLFTTTAKITAALSSAVKSFGMSRPSEIFYSIRDGNWNDLNTWRTVSGRVGRLPTANDDVYVKHIVTLTANASINNLFINNNLLINTFTMTVIGNINCAGILTITTGTFILAGNDNYINTFIKGTGTFAYNRFGDQIIMDLDYHNLTITTTTLNNNFDSSGIKYLINHLSISGNLSINGTFAFASAVLELGSYNLTVSGTTQIAGNNSGVLSKSGGGNILFIGSLNITRAFVANGRQVNAIDFSGNPDVELRGGVSFNSANNSMLINTGTGIWKFTTNNQAINEGFNSMPSCNFNCSIEIAAGITLTFNSNSRPMVINLTKPIYGLSGTSTLINRSTINFLTQDAAENSMAVGITDFSTFANIVGYTGNYSATIPSYFNTFSSLTISGTGTKTLGTNTTLLGNLLVSSGTFQLSTFNLTVTGTSIITPTTGFIAKNGAGSILFIGNFQPGNGLGQTDFRTGNPTVELRGGLTITNSNPSVNTIYTGLGQWTFTTNNQSMNSWNTNFPINFDAPVVIASGITLTVASTMYAQFSGVINGADVTSNLTNRGFIGFATLASVGSMTVGTFDRTTFANTVGYTGNYSATIPSAFTTFHNLTIGGTGTKTLGANTTLSGNLSIIGSGALQLSTFNFDVGGTTIIGGNGVGSLLKNGLGSILFRGNLSIPNQNGNTINFSGNPDVEFRNGFSGGNNIQTIITGTGTWSFTTNNQTIGMNAANTVLNLNANILIGDGIELSAIGNTTTGGAGRILLNTAVINGVSSTSKFINRFNTLVFNNPAFVMPMSTGIFDYNTFPDNTIEYSFNGSSSILTDITRNLTIGGTGIKSLAANMSIGVLTIQSGNLEIGPYNLTVNGTTTQFVGTISKTGAGNILFVGNYSIFNSTGAIVSFTGNPTIEFRNGLNLGNNPHTLNFGNGLISFTTNNQSLATTAALTYTFNNNILISGAITLTVSSTNVSHPFTLAGLVNGDNINSRLLMGISSSVNYQNATQPMATGILDTSTNLNTWIYGLNNQNIKGSPTISPKQVYRNLRFSGSGTTKTLQGFVSVLNTYTLDAGVTVNLNGFTLTNP